MNLSIARKIAKAAGVRLEFDRVLEDWEVRGSRIYKRIDSEVFGRMTEAEFELACKSPPQNVEQVGAKILFMPSAADRALARLRQQECKDRLPYERTPMPITPPMSVEKKMM